LISRIRNNKKIIRKKTDINQQLDILNILSYKKSENKRFSVQKEYIHSNSCNLTHRKSFLAIVPNLLKNVIIGNENDTTIKRSKITQNHSKNQI